MGFPYQRWDEGYSALLENEFHAIKAKDNGKKNSAFVLIY